MELTGGKVKKSKASPSRDELNQAFESLDQNGEGVTRKDLAEHLSVSGSAVGKAAKPLLDEGIWVVAKKRPITYALGSST